MRERDEVFKCEAVREIYEGQPVASVVREQGCAEGLLHRCKRDASEAGTGAEREV